MEGEKRAREMDRVRKTFLSYTEVHLVCLGVNIHYKTLTLLIYTCTVKSEL